jgi:putative membrane protein
MIKKITWALASTVFCICMITNQSFAQKKGKLTDPEIASVAVTANQIDISYAEIAKKKSKDADVLKFAQAMASDHQAIIDQAVALVTKLKVTPKDNAVSKQLMAGADKTKAMLNSKSAKDFDKAYIDNEVSYHKAVISTVQDMLIPEAQNAELKALLVKVMPTFKAHLAHAEMVQSKHGGAAGHKM